MIEGLRDSFLINKLLSAVW